MWSLLQFKPMRNLMYNLKSSSEIDILHIIKWSIYSSLLLVHYEMTSWGCTPKHQVAVISTCNFWEKYNNIFVLNKWKDGRIKLKQNIPPPLFFKAGCIIRKMMYIKHVFSLIDCSIVKMIDVLWTQLNDRILHNKMKRWKKMMMIIDCCSRYLETYFI